MAYTAQDIDNILAGTAKPASGGAYRQYSAQDIDDILAGTAKPASGGAYRPQVLPSNVQPPSNKPPLPPKAPSGGVYGQYTPTAASSAPSNTGYQLHAPQGLPAPKPKDLSKSLEGLLNLMPYGGTGGMPTNWEGYNTVDTALGGVAQSADTFLNLQGQYARERLAAKERQNAYAQNPASQLTPEQRVADRIALYKARPWDALVKDRAIDQQSALTQRLQAQATKAEESLYRNAKDPINKFLVDTGVAATDMGTKLALQVATGVPLAAQFGVQSGAESAQRALNEGYSANTAASFGLGSGGITAGVEGMFGVAQAPLAKAFGGKIAPAFAKMIPAGVSKLFSTVPGQAVKTVAANALGEGAEEMIEYEAQRRLENMMLDKNTPYDFNEQAYNGLVGGTIGGAFGGAQVAPSIANARAAAQASAEAQAQPPQQASPRPMPSIAPNVQSIPQVVPPAVATAPQQAALQSASNANGSHAEAQNAPQLPTAPPTATQRPAADQVTAERVAKLRTLVAQSEAAAPLAAVPMAQPDAPTLGQITEEQRTANLARLMENTKEQRDEQQRAANFAKIAQFAAQQRAQRAALPSPRTDAPPVQNASSITEEQRTANRAKLMQELEQKRATGAQIKPAALQRAEGAQIALIAEESNRFKTGVTVPNGVTGGLDSSASKATSQVPLTSAVGLTSDNAPVKVASTTNLPQTPSAVNPAQSTFGSNTVGAAQSVYSARKNAVNEIRKAAKEGIADNADINSLLAAERNVAKYEKELALFQQKYDLMNNAERAAYRARMSRESALQKALEGKQQALQNQKQRFDERQERKEYQAFWEKQLLKAENELKLAVQVAKAKNAGDVKLQKALERFEQSRQNEKIKSTKTYKLLEARKGFDKPTPLNDAPMDEADPDIAKVAEVSIRSAKKKITLKTRLSTLNDETRRKFIDTGNTIATVGKIANDPTLYAMYNNAKQARQSAEYMIATRQSNMNGETVGKGLIDILHPIQQKGDAYYQAFSEYLFHMHNIDRMSLTDMAWLKVELFEQAHPEIAQQSAQELNDSLRKKVPEAREYINLIEKAKSTKNKPVFGETVTAADSKQQAQEFLKQYPEFENLANDVYTYNRNLMQWRVDSHILSKEQADAMNELYPHYVPTFRDVSGTSGSTAQSSTVRINKGIKQAKGSNRTLLPLHESMARQTMQTVQAAKRNVMGLRLFQDAINNPEKVAPYVQEITPLMEEADIDQDESTKPELRNTFMIYNNGAAIEMKVDKGIYEGLEAISSKGQSYGMILSAVKGVNNTFKKLVTGWNPAFMIKNFIRDLPDAALYTSSLKDFALTYPTVAKDILTNSPLWQQYLALGGYGSSVYDYERGYDTKLLDPNRNAILKGADKVFGTIEALNFAVEQAPRFTEFKLIVKRGGTGYENLMQAMHGAADVTVNFGRSGTWGKTTNATIVPFFNPAIQGSEKLVRTITQAKGIKAWTVLVVRATLLGIAPSLVNAIFYHDDEEYKLIKQRDKDLNYLFKLKDWEWLNYLVKIEDGVWLKIPKGRVVSLFGTAAQRAYNAEKGQENAWAGYVQFALDQSAPINPFTSGLYAPIAAMSTGKTWYGTDIEPQRLQSLPQGERYDENTDYFSKWLGKQLNYSPKKINYLLDSYTGVIGDFVLPLLTPTAEQNAFSKSFVIDSVMSNKISGDFYDAFGNLQEAKNAATGTESDELIFRYFNRQAAAVSDLNKEMRAIEMSNISDKDKKEEMHELKLVIDALQQNALSGLKVYEQAVKNVSLTGETDEDYIRVNRQAFGAEYALEVYNKKVYEKAVETGIGFEAYFDAHFAQKGIIGDKDEDGKTIALTASQNKKDAIDQATPHLSDAEREKLYEAFGVSEKLW